MTITMTLEQHVPSHNIWRSGIIHIRIRRGSLIAILNIPIRGLLDHVLLRPIILFTLLCGRRYGDVVIRIIWAKVMPTAFWGSVASSGQRLHGNVV